MSKKIFLLLLGLLLIGANLYAAGDLQVNGALGIGTTAPTNLKAELVSTNLRGMKVASTMDQDGIVPSNVNYGLRLKSEITGNATGTGGGINLLSVLSSTASTVNSVSGGGFVVSVASDSAGTSNVSITQGGGFETVLNPGQHHYIVTDGYGFNLKLRDNRNSGSGSLHYDAFKHVNINDAENAYGALSADNLSGIWIEKQTLGSTSNYGIVLNGDGSYTVGNETDYGAAIVFGTGQCCKIYSQGGVLKATDSSGNITQFSPHDPQTGEWIFYSQNVKTGRTVRVDMERLVKAVEKLTGETFMVETLIQE